MHQHVIGWGTVIGAVGGFLASLLPDIIQMARDRFSHKRELEAKQAELDAAKAGYETVIKAQADAIAVQAEAAKQQPPTESDDAECPKSWVAVIRALVRPTLTYLFFALFAAVKLGAMYQAFFVERMPVAAALPILWDDETETLFSGVISFWFGSRAFAGRKNGGTPSGTKSIQSSSNLAGSARVVGE